MTSKGRRFDLQLHKLRRSDHVSDALACVNWLRLSERIKIAVLTYKVLHGTAP